MEIRPIAGALGAEIIGVDLRRLDTAGVAAIRRALLDHLVVFFRDQDSTPPAFATSPPISVSRSSILSCAAWTAFPRSSRC